MRAERYKAIVLELYGPYADHTYTEHNIPIPIYISMSYSRPVLIILQSIYPIKCDSR